MMRLQPIAITWQWHISSVVISPRHGRLSMPRGRWTPIVRRHEWLNKLLRKQPEPPKGIPTDMTNYSGVRSFRSVSEDELLEFRAMFHGFVKGKERGFNLWAAAAKLGEFAVPELKKHLEADTGGRYGRAAIIALHDMPPILALPLIEFAFSHCTYGVTLYFAAEYLWSHPTRRARELARIHLAAATGATRRILEAVIYAKTSPEPDALRQPSEHLAR
jgi:hypothetical protein